MDTNNWTDILNSLAELDDPHLQTLIDSSEFGFDGNFTIQAEEPVYSGLCQYYPLIETLVQDKTSKHLRLSLQSSVPMGTDSSTVRFEMAAANVTDAILKPESIAAVGSYLLRFVPYVGSSSVLVAIALRQAFYRSSREHGADQLYPRRGDAVTINVQSLLATIGGSISRAKFFRIFQQGEMDWFVQRAEPKHRVSNGRIRREANTYLYRGLVLTPGDAQDLYSWLVAQGLQDDPLGVLTKALSTPRDQILRFPYRLPEEDSNALFAKSASVHHVVSRALASKALNPTLAGLCDRLATHLIRPESFLAVPWYWFHKVLPELGDDLGMLYLMSKNCCYVDWARGKDRNTFWVPGGLPTLQGWIRSETLPKRIPHAKPSKRGRPKQTDISPESAYTRQWRQSNRDLASQYLCRLATRPSESGVDWQLQVSDVQLTASDESLKQAVYAFLYAPPEPINAETLGIFAADTRLQRAILINAEANPLRLCHYETLVNSGICQFETLSDADISNFDTLINGLNSYFETLIEAGICQFDTVINILNSIKYTHFLNQNTHPTKITTRPEDLSSQEAPNPEVLPKKWDYEKPLDGINPELKRKIQKNGLEKPFIGWLIVGCLNSAIHSPLSFAVASTLEHQAGPGGPAARMAEMNIAELVTLLRKTLNRLKQNYLGPLGGEGIGVESLSALLEPVPDQQARARLLQRLVDALGI